MKQTLQLKIGQSLTMTPQLQQAIRLLQLSTLELQQEIQQALEENPMLELEDEFTELEDQQDAATEIDEPRSDAADELSANLTDNAAGSDAESASLDSTDADSNIDVPGDALTGELAEFADATGVTDYDTDVPDDVPVDSAWEDLAPAIASPGSSAPPEDGEGFEARNAAAETLQDHLLWQLNLTPMTLRDQAIAMAIIDAINPDGILGESLANIHSGFAAELEIELDEVEAVLHRLQHFDPLGVAALDLRDCLLIQLRALPADTGSRHSAIELVEHHLDCLATRDFATLRRKTKRSDAELGAAVGLIQSLNPRPGSSVGGGAAEYVVPDVVVRKVASQWRVELNQEATPKVRINDQYAGLIKRADSSPDNQYLRDNLQEARWFLKSLISRNETLLKVAVQIVEHQRGFLEYGEEAMKPLVLHDIAQAVEMHESTISRVTTNKYMHTPRGIFELKYFFSSHVSTASGGEVSSTAIRALIKKLTAEENPKKPLSDSKIAAILNEQNIKVARRTVAKYRESLAIPPSNERKQLV